jgi:hypothetical protein
VATDTTEDEVLLDNCGQSLAEIWFRKGRMSADVFAKMPPLREKLRKQFFEKETQGF